MLGGDHPGPDLSRVQIGPRDVGGRELLLRQPRYEDFGKWRRIRLADRELIEPYWVSDELDWDHRHSRRRWIRFCVDSRRAARAGLWVSLIIEIAGVLAGQIELTGINWRTQSGEVGLWVDSSLAGAGAGGLSVAMMVDWAQSGLGLKRVSFPVSVANQPGHRLFERMAAEQEAVMIESLDIAGRRQDHVLYSITRDPDSPLVDYTAQWASRRGDRIPGGCLPPLVRDVDPPRLTWRNIPSVALEVPRMKAGEWWHSRGVGDAPAPVLTSDQLPTVVLRGAVGENASYIFDVEYAGRATMRCGVDVAPWPRVTAVLWFDDRTVGHSAIASAALQALMDYCFGQLDVNRVEIGVPEWDTMFPDLLAEIGMRAEGTMHRYTDPVGRSGEFRLWALVRARRVP